MPREKTENKTAAASRSASKKPVPGTAAKTAPGRARARNPVAPGSEERERLIREAAYFKAAERGFVGGSAEEDWLEAEREVNERLKAPSKPGRRTPPGGARRAATTP